MLQPKMHGPSPITWAVECQNTYFPSSSSNLSSFKLPSFSNGLSKSQSSSSTLAITTLSARPLLKNSNFSNNLYQSDAKVWTRDTDLIFSAICSGVVRHDSPSTTLPSGNLIFIPVGTFAARSALYLIINSSHIFRRESMKSGFGFNLKDTLWGLGSPKKYKKTSMSYFDQFCHFTKFDLEINLKNILGHGQRGRICPEKGPLSLLQNTDQ